MFDGRFCQQLQGIEEIRRALVGIAEEKRDLCTAQYDAVHFACAEGVERFTSDVVRLAASILVLHGGRGVRAQRAAPITCSPLTGHG